MFDSILSLIFPPRCEVCKTGSQEALCTDCFKQIKFMKPFLGIYSVSIYDGVLRTAIHRYKFKGRKRLSEALGILMVHYISHNPSLEMKEIDTIIPVPLHQKRHRERGFNQVEMLAQIISRYHDVPVINALERTRDTKANFDLPREERFKNIREAFKVTHLGPVYNKRVLLLDDIFTTGATIMECSRVLKNAGAKRIEVLTLSRAVE